MHRSAIAGAPRVIGRYLLCDAIASGGMATVHLGRLIGPDGFSRTVAIKQLHPQFARNPEFGAMFMEEARLASRIRHPNVVSPLDVVVEPPELLIVMEYVHGEPLSRLMKQPDGRGLPARIAAAIMGQVLLGLHAAHEAMGADGERLGIVHRDVSPQNILVTADGVARVVDFGIARASNRVRRTEAGKLKGKLGYMAPEQVNLGELDRRADVFAAGVVLWELLTGRRLFPAENPSACLQDVLYRRVPAPSELAPDIPWGLDAVVLCALARSPDERFQNARAMAVALDQAVPSGSMMELSTWVEERSRKALDERAARVAEVEGISFDEFTLVLPRAALSGLPPLAAAPELRPVKDSVGPTEVSFASSGGRRSQGRALKLVFAGLGLMLLLASAAGAYRLMTLPSEGALSPRPPAVEESGPAVAPSAADKLRARVRVLDNPAAADPLPGSPAPQLVPSFSEPAPRITSPPGPGFRLSPAPAGTAPQPPSSSQRPEAAKAPTANAN